MIYKRDESPQQIERLALSKEEAAQSLGIGTTALHDLIRAGELPVVRIGTRVLVPTEGLREWLRERAQREQHDDDDETDWKLPPPARRLTPEEIEDIMANPSVPNPDCALDVEVCE